MRPHPLAILILSIVALSVCPVIYVMRGMPYSEGIWALSSTGTALAFILWIEGDARRRGCMPCHDFGFLVAVFFPVSLVWYSLWTRGWKGLFLLAALCGLMYVPWLLAMAAWVLTRSPN
jgi:hypothetical protein